MEELHDGSNGHEDGDEKADEEANATGWLTNRVNCINLWNVRKNQ
jgi:hypothetical protein